MRAAQYSEYGGPLPIVDVPDPTCPPGGAVVRVEATGVCRSDWHSWRGHEPVTLPHIGGHEYAGVIAEIDPDVDGFAVGDRVTVPFVCGCGTCEYCRAGDAQVCPNQTQPGFSGPGSFAEFVASPRRGDQPCSVARRDRIDGRGQPGLPIRHRLSGRHPPRPARRRPVARCARLRRRGVVGRDDRCRARRPRGRGGCLRRRPSPSPGHRGRSRGRRVGRRRPRAGGPRTHRRRRARVHRCPRLAHHRGQFHPITATPRPTCPSRPPVRGRRPQPPCPWPG